MINWNDIQIPVKPVVIEFDQSVGAWYVRFSRRKIAKTISQQKSGTIVAIDLDDRNELIGLELLGVREFSVGFMVKIAGPKASRIDLSETRFVPAGRERELQPA